ncbi:hypothetical protein FHL15_003363 [Xylaria flabelliformis]|uniref:Uncharacterized protein n=1 Tax=Xylaria flabelliformis TaxID=2512241 RepID=A0A553I6H6_9PEZI|nr:hypothetical protein FHL15_003363 [Xylaria flabelliformis]
MAGDWYLLFSLRACTYYRHVLSERILLFPASCTKKAEDMVKWRNISLLLEERSIQSPEYWILAIQREGGEGGRMLHEGECFREHRLVLAIITEKSDWSFWLGIPSGSFRMVAPSREYHLHLTGRGFGENLTAPQRHQRENDIDTGQSSRLSRLAPKNELPTFANVGRAPPQIGCVKSSFAKRYRRYTAESEQQNQITGLRQASNPRVQLYP